MGAEGAEGHDDYEPDAFDETADAPDVPRDEAATRLINLTLALMSSGGRRTQKEIFRIVEGYGPWEKPTDAGMRKFERDKDALRDLGLPLQVGDDGSGNPIAYSIQRKEALLPPLNLSADQKAVLALAARAWSESALSQAGQSALRKLAGDVPVDPAPWLDPRLSVDDPSFAPLLHAAVNGRRVQFEYRGPGQADGEVRTVDAFGLASWLGRWYFLGHDADRGERRMFRLSRIVSTVTDLAAAVEKPPPDYSASREVEGFRSHTPELVASVRVASGRALSLRARARSVTQVDDAWDCLELPYGFPEGFADELAAWGPDVIVDEPAELRDAVVDRLHRIAALGEGR